MNHPKDLLGSISANRVLDVATGSGGFIHFLLEGLKDCDDIIGIDTNPRAADSFAAAFQDNPAVHFQPMDARQMGFADGSFDLVCISNSLHHFSDPQVVLREMERVARPGGILLLAEMYRDGQSETQLTHVLLHHWWAAVDRFNGITHNETYTRAGMLDLVHGWASLQSYDLLDCDGDPKNPEIAAELAPVFERYLQRADGVLELQAQGEVLRKRVEEVGFHSATTLVAIGRKPSETG